MEILKKITKHYVKPGMNEFIAPIGSTIVHFAPSNDMLCVFLEHSVSVNSGSFLMKLLVVENEKQYDSMTWEYRFTCVDSYGDAYHLLINNFPNLKPYKTNQMRDYVGPN